jgi:hypothetical protein
MQNTSIWTGMVPVDDTALAVTDTGGEGIPVIAVSSFRPEAHKNAEKTGGSGDAILVRTIGFAAEFGLQTQSC